ncbi:hypothetical protein MLD38_033717 [Melastoma candidum]|uniref:Uncharacterized protein n=1 Tax=Melastoma candidum TaxID=119954 RepID=A0ACB9M7M5_9MYRT|nr:hypothetical protein MLD38_033717 [Melastoma candidum]
MTSLTGPCHVVTVPSNSRWPPAASPGGSSLLVPPCSSRRDYSAVTSGSEFRGNVVKTGGDPLSGLDYLVEAHGWSVRKLNVEDGREMRRVARIQAEAFHEPAAISLLDDLFFKLFEAEVLSGLLYKLRNSPPDRYACLVAEVGTRAGDEIVGVVDVTVQRDEDVLRYLRPGEEYLYVSGIAVSQSFRRRKVATALLEACDVLSTMLGYSSLVLRAYQDDTGARRLYSNSGYEVVGGDSSWVGLIGRRRRVLMIKECPAIN